MKRIETPRLILKLYAETDKNDLIELLTDRDVMKYVDHGVLTSEQSETLWRRLHEELYASVVETIWAIFAKSDARYVGHAALRPRPTAKADWEISYILREAEWGKGFATEIARELIRYGFEELMLTRIFATVDDDNQPSIKVLEKAGMSFERYESDEDGRFSVYSIKAGMTSLFE